MPSPHPEPTIVVCSPVLSVTDALPVLVVIDASSSGAAVELPGSVVGTSGAVVGVMGSSGNVEVPVAAESESVGSAGDWQARPGRRQSRRRRRGPRTVMVFSGLLDQRL